MDHKGWLTVSLIAYALGAGLWLVLIGGLPPWRAGLRMRFAGGVLTTAFWWVALPAAIVLAVVDRRRQP